MLVTSRFQPRPKSPHGFHGPGGTPPWPPWPPWPPGTPWPLLRAGSRQPQDALALDLLLLIGDG